MKKKLLSLILTAGVSVCATGTSVAADLVDVYNDALQNDPTYLAACTTYLAALEEVPINLAPLLPQVNIIQGTNGSLFINDRDNNGNLSVDDDYAQKGYGFELDIKQVIFDFSQFAQLAQAKKNVKAAAATYYDAVQDLMVRVSTAYFNILQDEDVVKYTNSNVMANKRSLDQAEQRYKVGLNTLTDVYTSKAAYSSAVAENVTSQNALENDIENLRAITGHTYEYLAKLSTDFPLAKPNPSNIEDWVHVASQHNWLLASQHYTAMATMDEIRIQQGGHLPTVELDAGYTDNFAKSMGDLTTTKGDAHITGPEAALDITIPIYAGGGVNALTRQAEYNYQTSLHNYELQYRTTENNTRQDYLGVIAGISEVQADKSSVQSNKSALEGLEAGYKVGTQTMVDVLNQQRLLLQAQQDYATDRYTYVKDLINLKYDTGTLSNQDIIAINRWLGHAPAKDMNKEAQEALHTLDATHVCDTPKPTCQVPPVNMPDHAPNTCLDKK